MREGNILSRKKVEDGIWSTKDDGKIINKQIGIDGYVRKLRT